MSKIAKTTALLAVTLLLSSCVRYRFQPTYGLQVINTTENDVINNRRFEVCPGRLEASLSFPSSGVALIAVSATPQNQASEGVEHGSSVGAPFTVEAWCYAEDGGELGYAKWDGRLADNAPVYGATVTPKVLAEQDVSEDFVLCPPLTEERGEQPPCVFANGAR